MKALAGVLAVLLVLALAHPAAAAAVVGAELVVCGAVGRLIWRSSRFGLYPYWRTA